MVLCMDIRVDDGKGHITAHLSALKVYATSGDLPGQLSFIMEVEESSMDLDKSLRTPADKLRGGGLAEVWERGTKNALEQLEISWNKSCNLDAKVKVLMWISLELWWCRGISSVVSYPGS